MSSRYIWSRAHVLIVHAAIESEHMRQSFEPFQLQGRSEFVTFIAPSRRSLFGAQAFGQNPTERLFLSTVPCQTERKRKVNNSNFF